MGLAHEKCVYSEMELSLDVPLVKPLVEVIRRDWNIHRLCCGLHFGLVLKELGCGLHFGLFFIDIGCGLRFGLIFVELCVCFIMSILHLGLILCKLCCGRHQCFIILLAGIKADGLPK